jgi:Ca2+-binding RTX toxin-like protein
MSTRTRRALSEALEPRRLLAVNFNDATGILVLTSDPVDTIFQFEDVSPIDGPRRFQVIESVPTQFLVDETAAGFAAYIDSATDRTVFGPFNAADVRYAQVDLLGGDDLVIVGNNAPVALLLDAGEGSDTISAGPGSDTLLGNDGDDYLFGGGGDDIIDGGDGSDRLIGGDGSDTADYRTRQTGVGVLLDQNPNDGAVGEGDNVGVDFETIVGGDGGDLLDVSGRSGFSAFASVPVRLLGNGGPDDLVGGPGTDTLVGGLSSDNYTTGGGSDLILAEDGNTETIEADGAGPVVLGDSADVVNNGVGVTRIDGTPDGPTSLGDGSSTANLDADGVLSVTASAGNDRVFLGVFEEDPDGVGPLDPQRLLRVRVEEPGAQTLVQEFPLQARDPAAPDADVLVTQVVVDLLDGDDLFFGNELLEQVAFTPADIDTIVFGGPGDDTLLGTDGDDRLDGGGGNNVLSARAGNDTLTAGFGSDLFSGGQGFDVLDYSGRNAAEAVRVGLGRLPDDGMVGEGDNAGDDIEQLLGTAGADLLSTIGTQPAALFGFGGNDTIVGGFFNDTLGGGAGRDALYGGPGNDLLDGLDGEPDTLLGQAGNDEFSNDPNDVALQDGFDELP